MRIRGGQESSDDELLEEEVVKYDQVEYLESHTPEVVERLRAMMTEMGLNPSVDRREFISCLSSLFCLLAWRFTIPTQFFCFLD